MRKHEKGIVVVQERECPKDPQAEMLVEALDLDHYISFILDNQVELDDDSYRILHKNLWNLYD